MLIAPLTPALQPVEFQGCQSTDFTCTTNRAGLKPVKLDGVDEQAFHRAGERKRLRAKANAQQWAITMHGKRG